MVSGTIIDCFKVVGHSYYSFWYFEMVVQMLLVKTGWFVKLGSTLGLFNIKHSVAG